ncbi:HPP family protein [Angomonas deanei]|uniref:HPP family, putative n=1 Tax=Angomonas deanei TaxID=59799 RepID=S9VRW2_9TRYP|nr:HPP family protein [Angomonas deanei]EPY39202.1 HPP family protein [Angomonas deanei]CAD2216977.1 HPP family, putative [Angomonas deanei]|eukprot:EPY29856.1 HPP family protein [Angomonas deanei]
MRGSFVSAMLTEHEQVPDLLSQAILEEEDLSTLSSPTTVSALPHGAPMTRRSRLFGQGFSQHVFPTWRQYPKWYWKRMIGIDQSLDVYGFYPAWDQIYAFVFTCLTLVILALIEFYAFYPTGNHSLNSFIPAFGASCCVVFGIPKAPIAQPRNLLFSHVTAAIIGTALTNAFRTVSEQPFGQHCAGAIGVGLHLVLMMLTETMHPPASATVISAATQTLNAYYKDEGFLFVVVPVLFGSVIIFIMACLLNNLVGDRSPYPQYW